MAIFSSYIKLPEGNYPKMAEEFWSPSRIGWKSLSQWQIGSSLPVWAGSNMMGALKGPQGPSNERVDFSGSRLIMDRDWLGVVNFIALFRGKWQLTTGHWPFSGQTRRIFSRWFVHFFRDESYHSLCHAVSTVCGIDQWTSLVPFGFVWK